MNKAISLDRRFLRFGTLRRLWYSQVAPKNEHRMAILLKQRGMQNDRIAEFSPEQQVQIFDVLIRLSPQKAYVELSGEGAEIETVGFTEKNLFLSRRFSLLRSAHHSACRSMLSVDGFGDLAERFIDLAKNFNFVDRFCNSGKSEILAKTLLRTPFYVGGIVFVNAFLFPQLIASSDLFLTSKYFDLWEWSPLMLDSAMGLGLWILRSRSTLIKKAEPNKVPVPILGYWFGRIAKKLVFTVLAATILGVVFVPGIFVAISRYIKLRGFDWSKETSQEKANFLSKSLMRTDLQKSLLEHWIMKNRIDKARKFYQGILNNCEDPESCVHQGHVIALNKALNRDAYELLVEQSNP